MIYVTVFLFSLTGTVTSSLNGRGRASTTGCIWTWTLTTFPFKEYLRPVGNSLSCMNEIRNAINLSSNGCNSSSFGLAGHFIPYTIDNLGTLPLTMLFLHVVHIDSVLSIDKIPEKYDLKGQEIVDAFVTLPLNHVWWQQLHIYIGLTEMLFMETLQTFIYIKAIFPTFCWFLC